MKKVTRDKISYLFDHRPSPVLIVEPGEQFLVETEDSRTGQTRTPDTIRPEYVLSLRAKGPYYGNPVTGPILVRDAAPGDALAVHVHDVRCDSLGFFGYWPFVYHMQDWLSEPVTQLVEIRDGHVYYDLPTANGAHPMKIPVRPMIGCMGTAPDLEALSCGRAGRHGGNLDTPEIAAGSTVYLPVMVPGGLLYLGDCHPYQGDGEVSGCEMRAEVMLSVDIIKGGAANQQWPRVETAESLVSIGSGCPAEVAQWQAVREMIRWLGDRHGWTKQEARMFLAMTGDLRPGQLVSGDYTMRMIVSKSHLPENPCASSD